MFTPPVTLPGFHLKYNKTICIMSVKLVMCYLLYLVITYPTSAHYLRLCNNRGALFQKHTSMYFLKYLAWLVSPTEIVF